MSKSQTPAVDVAGLAKNYGPVRALKGVDLQIAPGEYFVLLGPSGGGKTTLLRLLGGFIRPTGGSLKLNGNDVSHLPPDQRPTSMVFQSYALFPHMNVEQNVGYGLKLKKLPKAAIKDRVHAMLEMVGLTGLGDRKPHEMSGGQQQRVQLARALVLERDILLLDEPLAALDAKLRKDMCYELKHLQEKVGITFVHVTHNQEEAMTVADRIAVIADGELVESGTAQQIYENPAKRFTADFIGENNIFESKIISVSKSTARLDIGDSNITVPTRGLNAKKDTNSWISVRSEVLEILPGSKNAEAGWETLAGTYVEAIYLGLVTSHMVALKDGRQVNIRNMSGADKKFKPGAAVTIRWRRADGRLHLD